MIPHMLEPKSEDFSLILISLLTAFSSQVGFLFWTFKVHFPDLEVEPYMIYLFAYP